MNSILYEKDREEIKNTGLVFEGIMSTLSYR